MQLIIVSHHVGDGIGFQTGGIDDDGGGKFKALPFFIMRENPVVARILFLFRDFRVINNFRFPV